LEIKIIFSNFEDFDDAIDKYLIAVITEKAETNLK